MTDLLPPPGYASDVPHPAIGVSIDVPDHWVVLDLNPQTWDAWLDAFVDQRLADHPRAEQGRGPVRGALRDLLARLHDEKVFLAAMLAGEVGGQLFSASATLAWRKLDDAGPIPLEGLRRVYAEAPPGPGEDLAARRVGIVELPAGGAVKVATRERLRVPGIDAAQLTAVTQYFVPVLDSDWLAVVTATTGNPALARGVDEVADGMVASLKFSAPPRSARPGGEAGR